MTLQQLIDSVTGNLGDRADGTIGGQPVSSVILAGVNHGLPQCVKLADPEYYTRTQYMTVESGSPTEIELQPVVINGVNHRIKDIVYFRTSRSDGTPLTMIKKTWLEFLKVTTDYDQQHSGVPTFLAFREGNMYINRVPEELYNFTLYVEIWPKTFTSSDYDLALPLGPEWDLALESFVTYYCYLKLQQAPLAEYWKGLYEDQKSINVQQDRKTEFRGQGDGSGLIMSGQPWLEPFTRRYN